MKLKVKLRDSEFDNMVFYVPMTRASFIIVKSSLLHNNPHKTYGSMYYKDFINHKAGDIWPTQYDPEYIRTNFNGIWVKQGYDNEFIKKFNIVKI